LVERRHFYSRLLRQILKARATDLPVLFFEKKKRRALDTKAKRQGNYFLREGEIAKVLGIW